MKFLFLSCSDPAIDPVAPAVLQHAKTHYAATPTSLTIGGKPVFYAELNSHTFYFAETRDIASALYPEIAQDINTQFSDVDMIGLINWHAGANAPAKIFCAHSTADVHTALFGPTSGTLLSATLLAIEAERLSAGLTDFRTLFEASHWSGTTYHRQPSELLHINAPVFDIEIGSHPEDWSNPLAQKVLAQALGKIPDHIPNKPRALYIGGTHFEPSATEIVFQSAVIEHHLPNQWIVSGEYNLPGAELKIAAAAKSCLLPPQLIVYHAGLKAAFKECARKAAELLQIPCASHKQLRAPDWQSQVIWNQKS